MQWIWEPVMHLGAKLATKAAQGWEGGWKAVCALSEFKSRFSFCNCFLCPYEHFWN